MLNDLRIPRMGSVENARLLEWRVAEGEAYAPGQVLYEIETDKTSVEVEADEPGILARRTAEPGDEFKVGDKIGLWAAPGTTPSAISKALGSGGSDTGSEDSSSSLPAVSPAPAVAQEASPAPAAALAVALPEAHPLPRSAAGGRRVSPLARRLAAQHGVDLADVVGTGMGGKISGKDVLAAAQAPKAVVSQPAAIVPTAPLAAPPVAAAPVEVGPVPVDAELVPHSLRRRTIAARMVQAAAIPSLTADMEVDLSALMALRKQPQGRGVSVLGLIAHAAAGALLEHPRLNAHWRDDAVVQFRSIHLGIAVDTPDGLVVPVIRNAERLSPLGLTEAIAEIGAKARDGQLRPDDLDGASFTISNPGSLGPVVRAEALLNPPQVALLGLPGIVHEPRAIRDGAGWATSVRPIMRPSLTFDHRALDGGPVIAFLNTLKARIESL